MFQLWSRERRRFIVTLLLAFLEVFIMLIHIKIKYKHKKRNLTKSPRKASY